MRRCKYPWKLQVFKPKCTSASTFCCHRGSFIHAYYLFTANASSSIALLNNVAVPYWDMFVIKSCQIKKDTCASKIVLSLLRFIAGSLGVLFLLGPESLSRCMNAHAHAVNIFVWFAVSVTRKLYMISHMIFCSVPTNMDLEVAVD